MNYKTKMMIKYKKLYGGEYYKDNGKWYWKKNPADVGVLVSSGWIIDRVNNYKPETPVPVQEPVKEPEPVSLPKPTQPKKKVVTKKVTEPENESN